MMRTSKETGEIDGEQERPDCRGGRVTNRGIGRVDPDGGHRGQGTTDRDPFPGEFRGVGHIRK